MRNPPKAPARISGTKTIANTFQRTGQFFSDHLEGRFGAAGACGILIFDQAVHQLLLRERGHCCPAALPAASPSFPNGATFIRLPADFAHLRAGVLRLAIDRVCQSHAAVSTILTEQTEFTSSARTHLGDVRANVVGPACNHREMFRLLFLLAAHRAQHRQRDPHGRRDRMRTAPRRTARVRAVRTQAAPGRTGLPRSGVGDRASRSAELGGHRADPGVRVHRARDTSFAESPISRATC